MGSRRVPVIQLALLLTLVGLLGIAFPQDEGLSARRRAGDAALAAGRYAEAIAHYMELAERMPYSRQVPLRLAEAYLCRHQPGPALAQLTPAYGGLNRAGRAEAAALIGWAWAQSGEANEARRWWELALEYAPAQRRAVLGLAELDGLAGQPAQAAARLRTYLLGAPMDAEVRYRLGLVLLDLRPAVAQQVLEDVQLSSYAPWAPRAGRLLAAGRAETAAAGALRLGQVLLDYGELEPALRQFERAAALQPTNALAQAYRGHLLSRLGRPALDALRLAVGVDRRSVPAHYFLAVYYEEHGLWELARSELLSARQDEPDNPALALEIAATLAGQGDYPAAEEWAEAAGEIAPDDPATALGRARFYLERAYRPAERGLPAAQDALLLAPESAEAHRLAGRAHYLLGRYAEALAELEQAEALAPNDAETALYRGETLLAAGQAQAGRTALEHAIDNDPQGIMGVWGRAAANRLGY